MTTYIQISCIGLDEIEKKHPEKVLEIYLLNPEDFVEVTEGDASLQKDVDLGEILSADELLALQAEGGYYEFIEICSDEGHPEIGKLSITGKEIKSYWKGERVFEYGD